ncbi:unnamed protein product [Brassicogethes aeneus]|uniref:TGF-beta family profile domain-containing protein n=1 Tax=Brassicogethes aeneus TaxID=1431903 RepID=A0A9P0FL00_BRAAE|nr:unnamed protein product [Brassicogethes aeneus]
MKSCLLNWQFFLLLQQSFAAEIRNITKKSYYFKLDQPKNEFRIHNRVHLLNYNVSDANFNSPEYLQRAPAKLQRVNEFKELYLDTEWDYNHTTYNKSELPTFLEKFYEKRAKKLYNVNSTTTRILFNENAQEDSSIIKFNLNSLKENESISDAELYFYWPLDNSSDIHKNSVVLRLYQFEEQLNRYEGENGFLENPDIHKLFSVIYISKAQRGWQSFKVKKAFNNWMNGEKNLGLILTINTYGDNKLISIFNDTNVGKLRTFVAVHVYNNETETMEKPLPEAEIAELINVDHKSMIYHKNQCQRKSWYIDFERLNWDKFIIYPEGYTAFDCFGKCYATDEEVNNNHIKLLNYFKQRTSYCVPTSYLPLPIMFFDENGNVVLKNYEDMVATQCGCR